MEARVKAAYSAGVTDVNFAARFKSIDNEISGSTNVTVKLRQRGGPRTVIVNGTPVSINGLVLRTTDSNFAESLNAVVDAWSQNTTSQNAASVDFATRPITDFVLTLPQEPFVPPIFKKEVNLRQWYERYLEFLQQEKRLTRILNFTSTPGVPQLNESYRFYNGIAPFGMPQGTYDGFPTIVDYLSDRYCRTAAPRQSTFQLLGRRIFDSDEDDANAERFDPTDQRPNWNVPLLDGRFNVNLTSARSSEHNDPGNPCGCTAACWDVTFEVNVTSEGFSFPESSGYKMYYYLDLVNQGLGALRFCNSAGNGQPGGLREAESFSIDADGQSFYVRFKAAGENSQCNSCFINWTNWSSGNFPGLIFGIKEATKGELIAYTCPSGDCPDELIQKLKTNGIVWQP